MKHADFNGVKELFQYFTFNRSVNMQAKSREKPKLKCSKDETFVPMINE